MTRVIRYRSSERAGRRNPFQCRVLNSKTPLDTSACVAVVWDSNERMEASMLRSLQHRPRLHHYSTLGVARNAVSQPACLSQSFEGERVNECLYMAIPR